MNFLGHLYFSHNDLSLMMANLYGDFVKGKNYSYLPPIVQKGVTLHRAIDHYIDNYPDLTKFKLMLYKELPKVAGIAIDLYFDHLLAKNWTKFHTIPLETFSSDFLAYTENKENQTILEFNYPQEYIYLINTMKKQNWLIRYKRLEGLEMASKGLSNRISFPNQLNKAAHSFIIHEKEITPIFFNYMEDAQKES